MGNKTYFKPRARLMLELGEQLIKNESVAILEMVKNCYDAFAKNVDVTLENLDDLKNGFIIIQDDGIGMTRDTVVNHWMEPATLNKKDIINGGKKLFEHNGMVRIPLGEKGIGRFGAHKLGNYIKLVSKVYVRNNTNINFDETDFMCSTLSDKWYKDDEIKIGEQKVKLNRKIIEVDITPNCDYAQNKNHMLRTIFGYIIEIGQVTVDGSNKWLDYKYSEKIKHKIQYDYIYVTPELQFKNKLCVLVLNTKYITIENQNFADGLEYLFRLNQDILAEIRKKSGDILTRIGINSL